MGKGKIDRQLHRDKKISCRRFVRHGQKNAVRDIERQFKIRNEVLDELVRESKEMELSDIEMGL